MEIGGNLKNEAHQLFGSKPTVPLSSTLVHTLVWIFVVGPLHFDVAFLWVVGVALYPHAHQMWGLFCGFQLCSLSSAPPSLVLHCLHALCNECNMINCAVISLICKLCQNTYLTIIGAVI